MDAISRRALETLKASRDKLTAQQYKTLKGQALAGDTDGALRGLAKLLRREEERP